MLYVLLLQDTIRLGRNLSNSVGPFDSEEAARAWWDRANTQYAIPLPAIARVIPIHVPDVFKS